jgi:hypothetical protein
MIARQATEWANEKGLEKGGLENSVAPGAMDALTTADRTLHSNRGPPYGKREREPALGRYKEMLLVGTNRLRSYQGGQGKTVQNGTDRKINTY